MIATLAIAAALALAAEPPPRTPGKAPPPAREEATPRPPLSPEDAEVVANLELLQQMDMLEDLPIVDPGAKDAEGGGGSDEH